MPPHKITTAQREALAAQLALDPKGLREAAGVTVDVAQRAIAGQDLAPEIITRLTSYLDPARRASAA